MSAKSAKSFIVPQGELKLKKLFILSGKRKTVKLCDVQQKFQTLLTAILEAEPRFSQMNDSDMLKIRAEIAASSLNLCISSLHHISFR